MPVSRRTFLLSTAATALASQSRRAAPGPNIVLIIAEDLSAWLLGCYGNREVRTPNIDLLARSGSRLANHTATSPVALATWATLLTGRTPRQHGLQGLPGEAESPQRFSNETTLGELLSQAGRRCAYVGAWRGGATEKPQHGFTHWRPSASSDAGWAAGSITRDAAEFLDAQQAGQPFFLVVTYAAPRPPYRGHPATFDQMYASSAFETLNWLPAARNAAEGKEYLADYLASMRRYAASVSALDSQIPAIVGELDKKGLRDSTLIVFTSTNGLLAGRHGLWRGGAGSDPWNLYAEGVETPMIWNWPGTVPVEGVRSELAGAYDLFPSLAEAAGIELPKGRPSGGRSYYPLMVNRPLPRERAWRNLVFAAQGDVEMARDARFKLVLRNRGEGPNELYDVRNDPRELSNQFNDDRFVTVRNRLAEAIRQWREQYS